MVWVWVTIAVLFAAMWLWAFYREDKRPEPLKVVAWACFWGAVSFVAAALIEWCAMRWEFLDPEGSLASRVTLMLLVVGPAEELCKFAAVRLFIYPRRAFNEPIDGIVYSVAAATAFALVENLYFMFVVESPSVIFARGPGYTLVHIVFSGFWGSALGWAKGMEDRRAARRLVFSGWMLAALSHGVFNLIIYTAGRELSPGSARIAVVVLVALCFAALRWQMMRPAAASRYRKRKDKPNNVTPPADDVAP